MHGSPDPFPRDHIGGGARVPVRGGSLHGSREHELGPSYSLSDPGADQSGAKLTAKPSKRSRTIALRRVYRREIAALSIVWLLASSLSFLLLTFGAAAWALAALMTPLALIATFLVISRTAREE